MPSFCNGSKQKLLTCHEDLQILFNEVVIDYDCVIIEGHRGQEAQDEAYRTGKSQKKYPNGNHNSTPSKAVDVAPYDSKDKRINWNDKISLYYFGGYVIATATRLNKEGKMKYNIRWGGDWDNDKDLHNQTFFDLVHFEILK